MAEVISIEAKRDSLARFLGAVEGTSLYVLRAIEQTVKVLSTEKKMMDAVAEAAFALEAQIRDDKPQIGVLFDPDDTVIDGFEKAYKILEAKLPMVVTKKAAIDRDEALKQHHCEELHESYDSHIESIATLIESLKNLRAAIITHDLAAEGDPGIQYGGVEQLVESLRESPIA